MSEPSDLRFAVVGLGFGANHARVLTEIPGAHLAAICDPDSVRLQTVAKSTGAMPYDDYATMLRDQPLDAVIVAVPARMHEAVAAAAIAAGCAVLVEKPLAPTLGEGRRLTKCASDAGVLLMPGHIERFNPAVRELARRVQAGEVGRVLQVTARRMGPMVLGTRDVNVIYDSALHDIDVMRYVLGAEVEHVYAEARSDLALSVEDSLLGVLRFQGEGGSGALGTLDVNWLASHRLRDLTVRGEKGIFSLDYALQTLTLDVGPTVQGRPGTRGWSTSDEAVLDIESAVVIQPQEPLRLELEAFVHALRTGEAPPVGPADALAAVEICDALTQSARTGQRVTLRRAG